MVATIDSWLLLGGFFSSGITVPGKKIMRNKGNRNKHSGHEPLCILALPGPCRKLCTDGTYVSHTGA
jgi:hypothetical protein